MSKEWSRKMKRFMFFSVVVVLAAAGCAHGRRSAESAAAERKYFSSPEAAADALMRAVQRGNRDELLIVLGPDAAGMLKTGDDVSDKNAFDGFAAQLAQKHSVEAQPDGRYTLLVGEKDWPFPMPLVSGTKGWSFDTAAGRDEIINRRIGKNELHTIRVVRTYVEAQKEYFRKDRDHDGIREYAQRIASSSGKKDGLYWEAAHERDQSPLGPLAAEAGREGYHRSEGAARVPYHGYFFKILTAQGIDAAGGKKDYFDSRGNLTRGFGLLAYPARWGASGVMSFIVNRQGVVYQRDLGMQTLSKAEAIKEFNPGLGWEPVADPGEEAVEE